MDINALGKFLLKDQPQENPQNRLLLEILDRITRLGDYYGEPDKSVLSKHAFNVRFAYFDRTREMVDAIPEPLLVRVADRNGVEPEDDFADLVTKRRARKRDRSGRFIREAEPSVVPAAAVVVEPAEAARAEVKKPEPESMTGNSQSEGRAAPTASRKGSTAKPTAAVTSSAKGTVTGPTGAKATASKVTGAKPRAGTPVPGPVKKKKK
jgi:hypothetical protein